jgi:hypothetical protein
MRLPETSQWHKATRIKGDEKKPPTALQEEIYAHCISKDVTEKGALVVFQQYLEPARSTFACTLFKTLFHLPPRVDSNVSDVRIEMHRLRQSSILIWLNGPFKL